jgi:Mce-associated membrane protein
MALVSFTVPRSDAWWWVSMSVGGAIILLVLVNRSLLPSVTGWSLGRALFGVAVIRPRDGKPADAWLLLLRDLAHQLDTAAFLLGWLWPLWDSRRRTFADMLTRTEVRCTSPVQRPANVRRWTAAAVLVAATICLAGAGVSYAVVYAKERATDQAHAQIAVQGPRIVARMLTYAPKSLAADFKLAQSLATDKYRVQLAAQQEVVQKGHPALTEYWVTSSAIQSVAPDRATMLLLMRGRRGEPPEQRDISATLRVTFTKDRTEQWRIDELTVLTKPKPPENRK